MRMASQTLGTVSFANSNGLIWYCSSFCSAALSVYYWLWIIIRNGYFKQYRLLGMSSCRKAVTHAPVVVFTSFLWSARPGVYSKQHPPLSIVFGNVEQCILRLSVYRQFTNETGAKCSFLHGKRAQTLVGSFCSLLAFPGTSFTSCHRPW